MTAMLRAVLPLALLVAPVPLEAKEPPTIDVLAPGEAEAQAWAWSARVGQRIERKMRYPETLAGNIPGIVDVTFMCAEDGRPTRVALASSSGHVPLDRAGLKAVRSVRSLHPLPSGVDYDKRYKARLLFATDDAGRRWLEDSVARRDGAGDRLATAIAQREGMRVVAVTIVPAGQP
jgi:TonB family protein